MAARTSGSGLPVRHDGAGDHVLRVGDPGVELGFVPDEVGLGEAGRVVEAIDGAGAPADDLEQRRTLPSRVGHIAGVAGCALLLEQSRAIRRLGGRQGHLRARHRHERDSDQKPEPDCVYCAQRCHPHHRGPVQTVGLRQHAMVVAGYFVAEQKRPRSSQRSDVLPRRSPRLNRRSGRRASP